MTASRVLAIVCIAASGACDCDGRPLAVLERHEGPVSRDHQSSVGSWEAATKGATFALGDGLRTGAAATAELRTQSATRLQVEPETIVRFAATRPEAPPKLALEMGAIQVETTDEDLEVGTRTGSARIVAGSRARVRAEGGSVRFHVDVGQVVVETTEGSRNIGAGRTFELMVGNAIREVGTEAERAARPPDAGLAVGERAGDAGVAPDAEVVRRALPREARPGGADAPISRGRTDWLLEEGQPIDLKLAPDVPRATVHAPDGRVNVVVPWPCSGEGSLEVRRGRRVLRHPASAPVALRLGPGAHAYRVRCPDASRVALSGSLLVRRDAGVRRLPLRPPAATARADGRRYSIRFQNQLPAVSLTWPDAPDAPAYELTVRSPRGVRKRRVTAPRVQFRSGSLVEGRYVFRFEAAGKRSPPTDLVIAFDNAARAASLSTPAAAGYAAGSGVEVAGVAMVGSRVSIAGSPVPLRSDGRFRHQVPAPGAALAVQVSHPSGGVHYYLRRRR